MGMQGRRDVVGVLVGYVNLSDDYDSFSGFR